MPSGKISRPIGHIVPQGISRPSGHIAPLPRSGQPCVFVRDSSFRIRSIQNDNIRHAYNICCMRHPTLLPSPLGKVGGVSRSDEVFQPNLNDCQMAINSRKALLFNSRRLCRHFTNAYSLQFTPLRHIALPQFFIK